MSSQSSGGALDFLKKENIIAAPGYNRWKVPPASIAIHMCIGSVYAWSLFNGPLTRQLGVVASSADDWSLASVVWIFSVAIVSLGLTAAFGGKWLEKVGPRYVGVVAGFCWAGGFLIGSVGISTHQLWLIYLGYGVLGGMGLGLGYVSPVSTLIRWFPDKRGMATGMAIMGFGGGAMIGAPLIRWLLSIYAKAPEYLGAESAVTLITEGGRRFAETAAGKVEVV
ncbi:MAG TPA: MFS transporter, partial [Rhodobacteraceae bacterium]|nr:MFS transporter [Paracoccaceae bacterium]